jgi:Tfp pilus assembly protein PilX
MSSKRWILFIASFVLLTFVKAQNKKADSTAIVAVFKSVLAACKENNPADPQIKIQGRFSKAAPYIVYRGADKKRAWKDFVNYSNTDEKTETDGICKRVNRTAGQDDNYHITKYITEKESEGTWHVLIISYKADNEDKKAAFAFLKIGTLYGLGDIDQNYK